MANNLKKFNTESEYNQATLNYPAVSWVVSGDIVHFDKETPTPSFSGLTVYYNITDISQPTQLFNGGGGSGSGSGSGGALPSAMVIDGTAVEVTNTYQFSTTGEHIVQYSFEDNQIPDKFMSGAGDKFPHLVGIEIGDAITSIGGYAFNDCNSLTGVTIPNSVTSIGNNAFANSYGLTSIIVNATTPPTLGNIYAFGGSTCPIYVPSASVNAYKTATNWSTYASRIQAIQ